MTPTIKDVAKCAGVGVGTVSRVLNGESAVKSKTRSKVLDAMKQLNYSPNKMAAKLRRNETRNIALLVPIVYHPFFAEFAYYVEDEADKFGYSVILVSSQRKAEKENDIIDRIKRREVDGAVFVTHFAHDGKKLADLPIVSIDRNFGEGIPYVTSDNFSATERAIRFLAEKGCKKIGFIGSKPLVESEVMERARAYESVMDELGMEKRMVNEVIMHGDENTVVKKFIDAYPDADGVFASGYTMSQIFYEETIRRGKRIPEDVQLISYDGAFGQWKDTKSITCLEQPIEEMARRVVSLLVKKIHGETVEKRTVLNTKFIFGSTTL